MRIAFGGRTFPPTPHWAVRFNHFLMEAGEGALPHYLSAPPITPPSTPSSCPPGTPPGTPPTTPLILSGSNGASLICAICFGITLGTMSFPAFINTWWTTFGLIIAPVAGGEGGGERRRCESESLMHIV